MRLNGKYGNLLNEDVEPLKRGTVVVCSTTGWKGTAEDLGSVVYDGEQLELQPMANGDPHPDGESGEVYVQTYKNVKMPSVKNCVRKFLCFCFRICFLFVAFVCCINLLHL